MNSTSPSESEGMAAALRAAHALFERAMLVKGMACISTAEVLGWTLKHSAAINAALAEIPSTQQGGNRHP